MIVNHENRIFQNGYTRGIFFMFGTKIIGNAVGACSHVTVECGVQHVETSMLFTGTRIGSEITIVY